MKQLEDFIRLHELKAKAAREFSTRTEVRYTAEEHEQIITYLKELQKFKEMGSNPTNIYYRMGYLVDTLAKYQELIGDTCPPNLLQEYIKTLEKKVEELNSIIDEKNALLSDFANEAFCLSINRDDYE